MQNQFPHKFHIPVMGLAYTIDTPVKVAQFGINSAVSIIEDNLVEIMRKYYYSQSNETYFPITQKEPDYREKRITDYLNLINRIIKKQVEKLRLSTFEVGSDIVKYFEMLPDDSMLKQAFLKMSRTENPVERVLMEHSLRKDVVPGSIEVNIMTKTDKDRFDEQGILIENGSDAITALRGYAKSDLTNSSVIFSAGMNPRLYNYLGNLREFDAKGWGEFEKRVIIKVSDYRSALIQGKYLAKKGVWVSEFRIESGLNCGGHAFATDGLLLGPILEEFKNKREELKTSLFELYKPAAQAIGQPVFEWPHPIRLTVQGGIGTSEENELLLDYFGMDSTGWGTPFLLCPEATVVDEETLLLLSKASEDDIVLSDNSPLGVRFNYLRGTSADREKHHRVSTGKPGSPCTEKFLEFNTEFTEKPICTASRKYQDLKIRHLQEQNLAKEELQKKIEEVESKDCLCIGLSNPVAHKYDIPFVKKLEAVTICPGPNIAYFSKISTLREMTDHIYGRTNIIQRKDRPNMFIKELQLYLNYIKEKVDQASEVDAKFEKYCDTFCENLHKGIHYYWELIRTNYFCQQAYYAFAELLTKAEEELNRLKERRNFCDSHC